MEMTTPAGRSEWHAAPLRPVACWVPETGIDGRTRLVMIWSVPEIDVANVVTAVSAGGRG
jgi:hypothetical protein